LTVNRVINNKLGWLIDATITWVRRSLSTMWQLIHFLLPHLLLPSSQLFTSRDVPLYSN